MSLMGGRSVVRISATRENMNYRCRPSTRQCCGANMQAPLVIFSNRRQSDANAQFQLWRRSNWNTGEFLTCAMKHGVKTCKLHSARCRYYGQPSLPSSRSFTSSQKVCSTSRPDLFEWALAQGANIEDCDCL